MESGTKLVNYILGAFKVMDKYHRLLEHFGVEVVTHTIFRNEYVEI